MSSVTLIGLDFGTTTSSGVIASAELMHHPSTGRGELTRLREIYRSDLVFTPFADRGLNEAKLEEHLDVWLAAGRVTSGELFGGGALLTGLAAQQRNADVVVRLLRERLGEVLIATADDPRLEAWLAFQASTAELSRKHPDRWFVNLDIGGGTTNIALGKDGNVVATGCLFVGARHIQVVPGSYTIVRLSTYAERLFEHLGIPERVCQSLTRSQVQAVLDFYIKLLQSVVGGAQSVFEEPVARFHEQVAFQAPMQVRNVIVTLSGGVGELVYSFLAGRPLPGSTYFGDLGIDFAGRLLALPGWADCFRDFVPTHAGRATVYGLLRHATQISGSTLFHLDPALLPLRGIPILGLLSSGSTDGQFRDTLGIAGESLHGAAVRIRMDSRSAVDVAALGKRLAKALKAIRYPDTRPLVLIVQHNIGKTLGHYVTAWGALPLKLLVLDEIDIPDAQFLQVGTLRNNVVPVSFYGMN
jgi:ethanolamine utilization protein EutA